LWILLAGSLLPGCRTASTTSAAAPPCPIRIRTSSETYTDAGRVRLIVEPPTITEIPILLPWETNYFAVNLGKRPPETATYPAERAPARSQSRNYPLEWGVPTSIWDANRRSKGSGQYELPPGRYQIIMRYAVNGWICRAATAPFSIEQKTFFMSTGGEN
jgi:hypothetical protein